MEPIVVATPPLTYAEYRKLSFADFRARYPYYYVGLPLFSVLLLIILAVVLANGGIAALTWQITGPLLVPLLIVAMVWAGTWFSLRRGYDNNEALHSGVTYQLNEQGITLDSQLSETILWSNIARTAVQSGQWIVLRQASFAAKEMYFLKADAVLPPASRTELLALLKQKRIKRI